MALSNLIVKISADTKEFVVGTTRVKRDAEGLKSGMKMLSQAITEGSVRLKEMAAAGQSASKEYKELKTQVSQARSALQGMGKELRTLQQVGDGGGTKMRLADAITGGLATGGGIGLAIEGINLLKQTITAGIRTTMDFDDAIRKVAATSGATASDMSMLREAAIEWGARTSFSASQAADAMNFMAQAGWNAQQTIEGLPGVLNLAASSGESLSTVSEIVTNNLNAFKLQASDSSRFADVLAAAAAASSTDVGNMGLTFKYVAPLAGALGFSIEDTAIAIGLMANNGIKGSQAGTGLAAVLANMSKPTADMQREMTKLNLSLTDNTGTVKPLRQLMGELRDAFKTLTPAQQLSSATAIAGKEAMAELLAIVTSTDDAYASMTKTIDANTGTAQRNAEIMEGGVGGAVRQLDGAWESLMLNMGGEGGIFHGLVQGATGLINSLNSLFDSTIDVDKSVKQLTDSMMREQIAVNATFEALKTSNVSMEARKQLIDDINAKAGPYLDNLLTEESRLGDVMKAQKIYNSEFQKSIKAKASEQMVTAALQKRVELEKKSIDLRMQFEKIKSGDRSDLGVGMGQFSDKQIMQNILKQMEDNREEIKRNESEYGKMMEVHEKATQAIAAPAGLNGAIKENTEVLNLNTDNGIQEHIKALKEELGTIERGTAKYRQITAEITRYEKMLQKAGDTQKKSKGVEVRVVSNLMGMDETTMFDLTDKMRKQVGEANILQGIFKNIDVLDVEINALSELIKEGVQAGVDPTVLQPYIDRLNELLKKQEGLKLGPDIIVDEQSLAMGNILEGAANKMRKDKLLANAFGEEFDAIGGEMSMLKDIITQGIEDNIGADKLDPLIERFKALSAVQKDLLSQKEIIAEFGNIAASAFEQIGSGSMTAAQGFAAVGKAALNASLDFLKGKLLESTGNLMKWAAKLGPLGIPIATAGVGALFALVKGAMSKSRAVAFADGGIVSGPVMGLVGEYAGASRNPEVIAPLDKLQSMLQGSGSTHVTGTFRVHGSDLVLALDNAQRKMSQFRV